jgi:tetratricopeptide (TPR) repeat protein
VQASSRVERLEPASLADLLDKPGLVAIRPDERNVAYKQEGLPPTAILTRATMIKIAERAGANLVVMGTYRIAGEGRDSTITITARVIDIREGRLVGKEYNRGGPLVDLQTARSAFLAGRDADALEALGKMLQIAPQNYDAHFLMGRVYERKGDFDRATNALKAAVFWNPKLVPAHVLLGLADQLIRQRSKAFPASAHKFKKELTGVIVTGRA